MPSCVTVGQILLWYFQSKPLFQYWVHQLGFPCFRMSLVIFVNPLFYLCLKQCLVGQIELVLCGIDIGILGQREFHERVLLAFAKQDAYGRLLKLLPPVALLHLCCDLMPNARRGCCPPDERVALPTTAAAPPQSRRNCELLCFLYASAPDSATKRG